MKKIGGEGDSSLFDCEKPTGCLIVPLEVAGVRCSEARHADHGNEFCWEDQAYFTTLSVTTFMAFCRSK